MQKAETLAYGLSIKLDLPYDAAIPLVREALKQEGFGVLTEIDVRQSLKEKIGADFPPYLILGACNPALAHVALQKDLELGLLLPCNVVVRQEGEGSVVSILDPLAMVELSGAEGLEELGWIARGKIERVLERLQGLARQ